MIRELVNVKKLIEEDLPINVRSLLIPAIKRAYTTVADHFGDVSWLNWPEGIEATGYLRRVAVEYQIKNLIDAACIPFEYRIQPNANGNCHHLEIITKHFVITTSQVQFQRALPRQAQFRQGLSVSNQLSFDFDNNEVSLYGNDGPYYMVLTHGYARREPDFISLGVPEPRMAGWVTLIDLLREPYQVEPSDVEVITKRTLVSLKDAMRGEGIAR